MLVVAARSSSYPECCLVRGRRDEDYNGFFVIWEIFPILTTGILLLAATFEVEVAYVSTDLRP